MEQSSKKEAMVTLAVLIVVVVIVAAAVIVSKKNSNNIVGPGSNGATTESLPSSQDTTLPQEGGLSTRSATYKDGTYSATGQYSTPDGSETITVRVTLKDGNVTDTSAEGSMKSPESREHVTAFLENYKPNVVGKSIAELSLSRLSGSSLTPQGFNRAIEQIRKQAQV